MNEILLNKNKQTSEIFQIGSRFPSISGASICLNGKEEFERLKIKNLKVKILNYLKIHDRVRISSLSELFGIPPRLIGRVLNELERDGFIKETE